MIFMAKMEKKIVLDNVIFSLQKGGGVSVVWSEHLKRLMKDKRFDVSCIEYNNAEENYFRKGLVIPQEQLEKRSSRFMPIKRYLNIKGRIEAPYVFHSSHYRIDTNINAKNVITVHDFVYEHFVEGLRQRVHSCQKWNAIRNADAIICISDSTKKDLLYFLPDIDEKRISVIYNGVDESYCILPPSEYSLNLPYETGEYLLYVGDRKSPYKNFKAVIDACVSLKLPLIIVGGGPMDSAEKKGMDCLLGEGHYCVMRGLSNRELNELYNRAYALVYPSLYEGFGIPIIEAQKAGTPVVCCYSSSIPEVVGDTDLCIKSCDTRDIIDGLRQLQNDEFRGEIIKKGNANSQRFSWDKTYEGTTKVYLNLL